MTRPLRTLALQIRDLARRQPPGERATPEAMLGRELAVAVLQLETVLHLECRLLGARVTRAALRGEPTEALTGQFAMACTCLQHLNPAVTPQTFLPDVAPPPSPSPLAGEGGARATAREGEGERRRRPTHPAPRHWQ